MKVDQNWPIREILVSESNENIYCPIETYFGLFFFLKMPELMKINQTNVSPRISIRGTLIRHLATIERNKLLPNPQTAASSR